MKNTTWVEDLGLKYAPYSWGPSPVRLTQHVQNVNMT